MAQKVGEVTNAGLGVGFPGLSPPDDIRDDWRERFVVEGKTPPFTLFIGPAAKQGEVWVEGELPPGGGIEKQFESPARGRMPRENHLASAHESQLIRNDEILGASTPDRNALAITN